MMGCDLRGLDAHSEALLTNAEVIGVNQDPLGVPARRVRQWGACEAWLKPAGDGSHIVALFNRGSQGADIELRASDIGLKDDAKALRDLWAQAEAGELGESRRFRLQPHDSLLLKVSGR
jgi:alpha-galactosidase